ncbi:MAG: membrane protein insertase YidC [Planctomycetes bacterium]|nr:membrane protein insertase YidC [Planctomycetota bacterium]
MDKDTVRNMLIAAAIFFGILVVGPRLLPLQPPNRGEDLVREDVAGSDRESQPTETTPPASQGGAIGEVRSGARGEAPGDGEAAVSVREADVERVEKMGADLDAEAGGEPETIAYRMQLVVSNLGGGSVVSATLSDHDETVEGKEKYKLLAPFEAADGRRYLSLGINGISIDGVYVSLSDKKWHSEEGLTDYYSDASDGQQIEFFIDVHDKAGPAVRLTRRLRLPRQPEDTGRHDLFSDLEIENLSDREHRVVVTMGGGMGVRRASPRMDDRVVDFGMIREGRVAGTRVPRADVSKADGLRYRLFDASAESTEGKFAWAATANSYFTCIMAPRDGAGRPDASQFREVRAIDADGDTATDGDLTLLLITVPKTLQAGERFSLAVAIYLGEMDPKAFKREEDYRAANYYFQIEQGFSSCCTIPLLVEMMIGLLNGLHWIIPDYGLAIIMLVLIVRGTLHPVTKWQQVSMVRMQSKMGEVAPQLAELKKKYPNDRQKQQQEQMKVYKEHGINPMGQMTSCLPMALQMPIWIALFMSLGNNIEMRHEGFLFTWVRDLTQPDALIPFATPFVLPFGIELRSFNLLPLLVSLTMYIQQKLMPKPKPNPNQTDEQKQQQAMMQKMMPMMSIMMLFFFYGAPSGLNLYIMSSSIFGAIEQARIRKHIRDREEAGTLHAPPKKKAATGMARGEKPKLGWFSRLSQMADQAQKQQKRRGA